MQDSKHVLALPSLNNDIENSHRHTKRLCVQFENIENKNKINLVAKPNAVENSLNISDFEHDLELSQNPAQCHHKAINYRFVQAQKVLNS